MRAGGADTGPDPSPRERITYLVANFNQEQFLPDCLRSLRAQTCDRWRAVIWDDASTDGSTDVVRSFLEPRIRLVASPVNVGYVEALRNLLELADTDIVGVLDPDDALAPEATERVLRAYAGGGVGFVHSRAAIFDASLTVRRGSRGSPVPPGRSILEAGFVSHLKTFRRSVYRRTEGLDGSCAYAEDRDLVYKLEEVARPVFVDAELYLYRLIPGSRSRDAEKRELGARRHLVAKRRALSRRGVTGSAGAFCRLLFWCEYALYSGRHPKAWRFVIRRLYGALRAADRVLGVRERALRPRPSPASRPSAGGTRRPASL